MPCLDWMLNKTLLYSCIILWSHSAISKSSAIGKRLLQNTLTPSWASSANWGNTSDSFLGEQNSESEPWYNNICSQNQAQNHDLQAWLPLRVLWERCGPTAQSSHFIPSKQHNINLENIGFFSNVPKNSFQVYASRGVDSRVRHARFPPYFIWRVVTKFTSMSFHSPNV